MENNIDIYKVPKISERKIENPDDLQEYCKIFPIFSNLEGKCLIR